MNHDDVFPAERVGGQPTFPSLQERSHISPSSASESNPRRALVAGAIGNAVEWYDFAVYGVLASIFAGQFFPSDNPTTQLLAAFALFGVGFVMRPLRAVVFGYYGDRIGRRAALSAAVIMMSTATLMIGVIPTYAQVGLLAPLLLCVARLLQGFSAGGEWGGSTSFMVEYAPAHRRGLYGSWQQCSVAIGFLTGSIVAAGLTRVLGEETMSSWGWRMPFVVGGIIGVVGLYLRIKLEDTPAYLAAKDDDLPVKNPVRETLMNYRKESVIAFFFPALWNVTYYTLLTFMPTYIAKTLGYSTFQALGASVLSLTVFAILIPVLGSLSDRIGRKPLMITSAAGFTALTLPVFILMANGGYAAVLTGVVIFAVLLSAFSGPGPTALAEVFPTEVRYTALSIGYNFSSVVFGGTAPFLATYLIDKTGSKVAPAAVVIVGCAITLIVVLKLRETAHEKLA
ncbi:MAG: MFS transporter [Comamonadaceae bacterium]|nr:MAG: MFS transporter [Comamonadaceae bacterium]